MDGLELCYPAKPWIVSQGWGIRNPLYQQFGFSLHNGVDFGLGADKKLYAPCGGTIVRVGNQPNGGGIYFGLMTDYYDWDDGKHRVLLDFLHCERVLLKEGDMVKTGDVMAIADNTGLSTGPHTHMQPRRVAFWNKQVGDALAVTFLDTNDANGTFDPQPFWTGIYACDYEKWYGLNTQLILILQRLVGLLQVKN